MKKKLESDSHNVDPLHMTSKWRTTSKFKHSTEQIMNENSIVYKQFFILKGLEYQFDLAGQNVEQCHMSHIIYSM